jgi:hypothetical protein
LCVIQQLTCCCPACMSAASRLQLRQCQAGHDNDYCQDSSVRGRHLPVHGGISGHVPTDSDTAGESSQGGGVSKCLKNGTARLRVTKRTARTAAANMCTALQRWYLVLALCLPKAAHIPIAALHQCLATCRPKVWQCNCLHGGFNRHQAREHRQPCCNPA